MARGLKQQADDQRGLTNKAAAGEAQFGQDNMHAPQARSDQMYGVAQPVIEQMTKRPGYSDASKSTMRRDVLGGVTSAHEAAGRNAMDRSTRTNNSAGYNELAAELARSKGRDTATAAGDLDLQFANEEQRQKETGAQMAGDMFGVNQDTLAKIYGTRNQTLSNLYGQGVGALGARAQDQGWTGAFSNVAGGIGSILNPFQGRFGGGGNSGNRGPSN